ncbi:hypothetical protein PtB15_6B267 [Puccinia triticina]|nr:hypothetical protein PtB15_6B267 [Puccinia triticina]
MEILAITGPFTTPSRPSNLYVFPIWLVFVSTSNSILNLFLFRVLNRLKFRFEIPKNLFTRFIILAPQTHFFAGLFCKIELGLFAMKKDMSYIAIDLCLGNLHILCLLMAMNLTRVGSTDGSDVAASASRKSRRFTISDLNIEIPMNPLSARFSRTRLSSDWAETFLHGTETVGCKDKSEKNKEPSSSSSSFTATRSNDLKAFVTKR